MSYSINFELKDNIKEIDEVIDYGHFQIICENKNLLYLYHTSLDYDNSLMNGGSQFINPSMIQVYDCGKSFRV